MKVFATLHIARCTPEEQLYPADVLSGIAADIRKGEDKSLKTIQIGLRSDGMLVLQ